MKLNILSTGVLCNDPLISYAAEQLSKANFENYFEVETNWIIVTHSQERAGSCISQSNPFKNVSVIVDEESREDRTSATRRALSNLNIGDYVWMMPEGFIPSENSASKIFELTKSHQSAAIEGRKCSGLDHLIFEISDSSVFKDNQSMLSFFNEVREKGLSIPADDLSMGSLTPSQSIANNAKTDMEKLSVIYWNLKYSFHHYTNVYEPLLNSRRFSTKSFLEIGVAQGASLRTFRDFFPSAKVFGLDIYPESILNEPRINVVIGDSSDPAPFLELRKMNENENFDVIIDDGSHKPSDQIKSFEILWPMLSDGGLYIIEDVQCEMSLKNDLAKLVPKSSIVTFDLRTQSKLVDSGIVLISK